MQDGRCKFGLAARIEMVRRREAGESLREIAGAYHDLLDLKLNRVRAAVTLARPADEALQRTITEALSRQLEKEVIPAFSVDPEILGGTIVRIGERIHDGSVRRRVVKLRRQLLAR